MEADGTGPRPAMFRMTVGTLGTRWEFIVHLKAGETARQQVHTDDPQIQTGGGHGGHGVP